jgi:RNA polymerase sigma-70 factor, ECF subfamily
VIEPGRSTHYRNDTVMLEMALSTDRVSGPSSEAERAARLTRMFVDNYRLVWRLVRRLGIPRDSVDDATQEVFLVAAERLDDIQEKSERAFVYGIALRVARSTLRSLTREPPTDQGDERPSLLPRPDELADRNRAVEVLDRVLAELPMELRAVFILFEIEGITMRQIAEIAEIPPGTVASRLRRARGQFRALVAELGHRQSREEGTP